MGITLMGLDISAYTNVKPAKKDGRKRQIEMLNIYEDLSQNVASPGWYDAKRNTDVGWSAPYSYYNRFREWLCRLATGLEPTQIWENPNPDLPFVELINFADNEGWFDCECCKALYADFVAFESQARVIVPETYTMDYCEIMAVFKVAAEQNGAVRFY